MYLSKTDFILYRECPNNVWFKKHKPEIYSTFKISEFEKALGVMGDEVEELARGMFPGGFLVQGRGESAQKVTQKLIKERTPVIFQATFLTDKYVASADVLKWNNLSQKYDIYEIKMSSTGDPVNSNGGGRIDRKKETQYEYDLTFQTNIIESAGVLLNKKYLVRLNREYIKNGDLDFRPNKLFIIEDKTETIDFLKNSVKKEIEEAHLYLSAIEAPPGPCPCYYKGRSSHCTAFSYINPNVPDYSIHDLNRIGNRKKYLRELLDEGVLEIGDVPIDSRLKPKETRNKIGKTKPRKLNQVLVHNSQEPLIDTRAIRSELRSLAFPLYFLDYETYPTAIPLYDGYRPYQQVVFQYSLHMLKSEKEEPIHKEYLALGGDPSRGIAENLKKQIGSDGTVIVWFKPFENTRNKEMSNILPNYRDFFLDIIRRTYDLMDIVEKQYYVHPGFKGRSSIKNILPVLAPSLSYKSLEIQSGTDVIEAYREAISGELSSEEIKMREKQMLEYCKLDTYAMYLIWKYFSKSVGT